MLPVDRGAVKHRTFIFLTIAAVLSLVAVIPALPAWAAPVISVSPDFGAAGTRVAVSGTNFNSYVGDNLSIFFGDREIAGSPVEVSAMGQFQTYFDVPDDVVPGMVIVSVKGPLDSVLAEFLFTVPAAEIELNISSVTIGSTVTATGGGLYADSIVSLYFVYDGVEIALGNTLSDPAGQYHYDFIVPMSPAGVQQVIARDEKGNLAIAGLEIVPSMVASTFIGTYEDTIEISGIGFSSESVLTIYFGSTVPLAYKETDAIGGFEGTFNVPELASGIYNLNVVDVNGYTARLQFTVTAGVRLNLTTVYVGAPVVISGTGFAAGVTVSIHYDDIRLALATTDEFGSFSATFEVPASASGEHTVSASAGDTIRQLVCSVESEAPPAPKRLQPKLNNEELPSAGFIWESVDDDSQPVTYTLQIATDEQFTDVVLEKTGLIAPQYALTGADRLPSSTEGAPYYWRIRAVDAASNEGEWSTVGSFHWTASSLPLWVIIAMIAAGVIIAGFFIYWIIRRETRYAD
jgi:hypothetical protein